MRREHVIVVFRDGKSNNRLYGKGDKFMKKHVWIAIILSVCLVCMLTLGGCKSSSDDDDNGTTTPVTLYDVTGTWMISAPGLAVVWTLTQDAGGNITGTAARTADTGTITGTNVNNAITIDVTYQDATAQFTGNVQNENLMSGTYSDSYGTTGEVWSGVRSQ
jgi:hypothetical protein